MWAYTAPITALIRASHSTGILSCWQPSPLHRPAAGRAKRPDLSGSAAVSTPAARHAVQAITAVLADGAAKRLPSCPAAPLGHYRAAPLRRAPRTLARSAWTARAQRVRGDAGRARRAAPGLSRRGAQPPKRRRRRLQRARRLSYAQPPRFFTCFSCFKGFFLLRIIGLQAHFSLFPGYISLFPGISPFFPVFLPSFGHGL